MIAASMQLEADIKKVHATSPPTSRQDAARKDFMTVPMAEFIKKFSTYNKGKNEHAPKPMRNQEQ